MITSMPRNLNKELKKVGMHIEPEEKEIDVICGMEINSLNAKFHAEHCGETYYFYSKTCRDHFVNDPEKYIG